MRLALVGCGWWATQFHLPAMLGEPGCELVGLCDSDPERLERARGRAGAPGFTEHRALLEAASPEAVVVAVPHAVHFQVARDCLEAGAHILVEKPLTLRSDHARELVRLAADRRLEIFTGYNWNYTSTAERAARLVRAGGIGDLRLVAATFASMTEQFYGGRPESYHDQIGYPVVAPLPSTYSDPALAGGGQGQSQVTHTLGMIVHVTGRRVTSARAQTAFGGAVETVFTAELRFDGGALGAIASTGTMPSLDQGMHRIVYFGADGWLEQDLRAGSVRLHPRSGEPEAWHLADGEEAYPFAEPVRRLVRAAAGEPFDNPAPGHEAAQVVEILEAAYGRD